jgi:hypothetical protein
MLEVAMFRTLMTISTLLIGFAAAAQEPANRLDFHLGVEYQYIRSGIYESNFGLIDIGNTDTHVLLLSGAALLGERWEIFGSIPYVRKRHLGMGAHNANLDFPTFMPPDLRVVDDGEYHGGLQDATIGVRYKAVDGPFSASPFLSFGTPMSNYPTYGNAAIGKQLWELAAGVGLEFTPYFSDWTFQADIAYVFTEDVLDINLDYWFWYASASYYVTPRFAPRVFLTQRDAPNALSFPEDFTQGFDNENWYQHDRTMKHNFLNGGIGLNYIISDSYAIQATYFKTLEADNVAEIDYAFTLGLTYAF